MVFIPFSHGLIRALCWYGVQEMGLLGSTAWGEANAGMLSSKAIAYLNVDSGVSGPQFAAGGTPSLWSLLRSVAWDVQDPNTQRPMSELWPGDVDIIGSGSDCEWHACAH
jgi:N-acetylated-alpha-linked acidic dipeptidase